MSHSANSKHSKVDTLMDIEYVQASKTHQCIQKLVILLDDGETSFVKELKPCMLREFLELKYKKSFKYCRRKIHHLDYYPRWAALGCVDAINTVQDILEWNGVQRVLYKGGDVERKLCEWLNV